MTAAMRHKSSEAPARQRRGLENPIPSEGMKGNTMMTQQDVAPQQLDEALRPGDRYQYFDSYGYFRAAGVVIEHDGGKLVTTRDGDTEWAWTVPAAHCVAELSIEPLDPAITDPFAVAGWRSAAALRLRAEYEELAGFVDGKPSKRHVKSRDEQMTFERLLMQETADNDALAALLPITPCPAWCTLNGQHAWECPDPGDYERDHRADSEVYGDAMQLTWLEGNRWGDSKPYVSVNRPAIDYLDDGISIANAAPFAAELLKMAALVEAAMR